MNKAPVTFPFRHVCGTAILLAGILAGTLLRAQPYDWNNLAGHPGGAGSADGTGGDARFSNPGGVAVDSAGNTYVADSGNGTVRKMTPAGVVTTLAGSPGVWGSADGTGREARFGRPAGVAISSTGTLYVTDYDLQTLRKVTPAGVVTTLAGSPGAQGSNDGTGSAARFSNPAGVAVDGTGNLYVADSGNHTIRKVTPTGIVSTLAGSPGAQGSDDGVGSEARFNSPIGVALDNAGNLYVADRDNRTLRKVTPGGVVTTLAGNPGVQGSADGSGDDARFGEPDSVALDSAGNIYLTDHLNHTLRKITSAGEVTTLAGSPELSGSDDGSGGAARFTYPAGVALDRDGNLCLADSGNHTLRKVTMAGVVTTPAGSVGIAGNGDGTGSAARFSDPSGVAVDSDGNLYVANASGFTLRKITPAGVVTTLAGLAGTVGSADGTGNAARFNYPSGVALDGDGNLYVTDSGDHTLRKVSPEGVVTTLAGLAGVAGSADGTGSNARFLSPRGVALDSAGNLYVADSGNNTLRKVTPTGSVTTLAGLAGAAGSADGMGSAARFLAPRGVALDSAGNLYVADTGNHTLRKVTPTGSVTTLAGSVGEYDSVDGTGSAARFFFPYGVAVGSTGSIFVTDFGRDIVRKVTPAGVVTTLAGRAGSPGSDHGTDAAARFWGPDGIAVDSAGNLYVADSYNSRISKGIPPPTITTASPLPSGAVGAPYSHTMAASGGATPYTWSLAAGTLPVVLELSSAGVISGTPTAATTRTFTVQVTGANALFSTAVFSLTIEKGSQTITFAPLPGRIYGTADVALSATASSGLLVSYASSNPAVATIVAGSIHIVGAGNTTITASQAGDANWHAAPSVPQDFTVGPAPLTITAAARSKTYGQSVVFAGSEFTVLGLVAGDSVAAVTLTSLGAAAGATVAGSPYAIVASAARGVGLANYSIGYVDGALSVTRAPLSVVAAGAARPYAAANPGFSGTLTGVTAGDDITASYASAAGLATPAGVYGPATAEAIVPTLVDPAGRLPNYTVTSGNGTLTVTKADQTITFAALPARTYRDADVELSATASSGLPVSFASSTPAVATVVAGSLHIVGAGNTTISASQSGDANWNPAPDVPRSLTVNKATATVTLSGLNHIYDRTPRSATVATDPLGLTVTVTYAGSATAPLAAGEYAVAASVVEANWQGSASGTLIIAKADQTITFAPLPGRIYGNADFAPGATATSGLLVSYASSNPAVATLGAGGIHFAGAGSATITASQAGDANWNAAPNVSQDLSVGPAPLTITATDRSKTYGQSVVFAGSEFSTVGLLPGDSVATVSLTSSGAAAEASVAGSPYTITASAAQGARLANYTIAYVNGALTIGRATPTILWTAPAPIEAGTALGAAQLRATANLPGTFVYSPPAGTVLPRGDAQPLRVDFTPTDDGNWTAATATVPLDVYVVHTVLGVLPVDEAIGVPVEAPLRISFSEPVFVGTGDIIIRRAADGTVFQAIPVSGSGVAIAGRLVTITHAPFVVGDSYSIEVGGPCLVGRAGNAFAGIAAGEWDFLAGSDRGLWDLSGVYTATVEGKLLTLNLVHDSSGKLGGTATYTIAAGRTITMPIKGRATGAAGDVLVEITLQGTDLARTAALTLRLKLTLNAAARQISGPLSGSITIDGTRKQVAETLTLAVPGAMDGTWTLRFQLVQGARSITGTALLTLANGVDYAYAVQGKRVATSAVLSLAGDPADPAAKAFQIRTTLAPLANGAARPHGFSGKGYGQSLGW
jgi:sugar lactone lactonase YvrE